MIAIMSMTPVHLIAAGHGMSLIGLVLSAHTLGMFALSPLSGRLADRFGPVPVVIGGLAVVAGAGVLAAIAPASGGLILITALFLLGFGWNLAFVAGSTLVARDTPAHIRIRVQGLTDAAFWSSAAAGSALAGVMLELTSYGLLALVATGLALLAIGLVAVQRRAPVPAGARS
jgi:MFS family permease